MGLLSDVSDFLLQIFKEVQSGAECQRDSKH